jgi:hypothetical protein
MRTGSKAKVIKSINDALRQPLTELTLKSVLADTRKLLEIAGDTSTHITLKFYCDWVLHTKMDRTFAVEVLRRFDEIWDKWVVSKIPMPADFERTLGYQISFYGFEQELTEFLGKHGVVLPWVGFREKWLPFEKIYCGIVEDSWLEYPGKAKPLKHINGAKVRTYKMAEGPEKQDYAPGDYLPLGIEWAFTLNDKLVFVLTITFTSANCVERDRQSIKSSS